MTAQPNKDTRTSEQRTADVAASALARLARMRADFRELGHELYALSRWADDHNLPHEYLESAGQGCHAWRCCVVEAVRDVAETLPIRGLEFGSTEESTS